MRPFTVLLLAVTLVSGSLWAKSYQSGTLLSVDDITTPNLKGEGPSIINHVEYRLNVQLGGFVYVCSYNPPFEWSYKPNDLLVKDAVEARVEGDHLYIKRHDGKELKTTIVRRMRATTPSDAQKPSGD